jgi:hypothetical protein
MALAFRRRKTKARKENRRQVILGRAVLCWLPLPRLDRYKTLPWGQALRDNLRKNYRDPVGAARTRLLPWRAASDAVKGSKVARMIAPCPGLCISSMFGLRSHRGAQRFARSPAAGAAGCPVQRGGWAQVLVGPQLSLGGAAWPDVSGITGAEGTS